MTAKMNVRTICLVLSADKLNAEREAIAAKGTAPAGQSLIEGHFMRCGHVFELMGMPQFQAGDMVLFSGIWGQDSRERRVRLHINCGYFDSVANTWFNCLVVVTPCAEHRQADWDHDGVATVMKNGRTHSDIDLLATEQPVCNAALIGWEYASARPIMPMMILGTNQPEPGTETGETGEPTPGEPSGDETPG